MIKQTRQRGAGRLLASLCLASIVAGCASHSVTSGSAAVEAFGGEWLSTGGRVTYLSAEHSGQVAGGRPGQVLRLGATPWGEDTLMTLHEKYFSAAGNRCYSASVLVDEEAARAVNLCDYGQGLWGATRAIVQALPAKQGGVSLGGLE